MGSELLKKNNLTLSSGESDMIAAFWCCHMLRISNRPKKRAYARKIVSLRNAVQRWEQLFNSNKSKIASEQLSAIAFDR